MALYFLYIYFTTDGANTNNTATASSKSTISIAEKAQPQSSSGFSLSSNGRLIYNKPLKKLDYEQYSFISYDMQNGEKEDEIMVRDGYLFVVDSLGTESNGTMFSDKSMAIDCLEFTVRHSQFGSRKKSICQANKNTTVTSQSWSGSGSFSVSLNKGELFYIFEDLGGGSLGGMAGGKYYRCLMTDEIETKVVGTCKFN